MRQAVRFLLPLLVFLGCLAWGAATLVNATTRRWYEKDMRLRAELAIRGAQDALAGHWNTGERRRIGRILEQIARDERIMAGAACTADMQPLAATPEYPAGLTCAAIGRHVRVPGVGDSPTWTPWSGLDVSAGAPIHVSAIPVADADRPLGFVVLVHDLSFVERRAALTWRFTVGAFGIVAVAAGVVTVLTARFSRRSWMAELRRLLRGGGAEVRRLLLSSTTRRHEFRPILQDVRELVSKLATEEVSEPAGGWTPERLRQTLTRHLQGEGVVILANREPYVHDRAADGSIQAVHPASGLVTALEPVMRACSGVWVAHGSGNADRETVDAHGHVSVPPGEDSYELRRVWLSEQEEKGYYYGFANEGLWPLCHIVHTRPTFRADDWAQYRKVNRKFAEAVCDEVDTEDPIILVQDYHFALVPRMIREKLPRASIITFWHIPWPNSERFGICPWPAELLDGLLGSSILGFHTQQHCNNFVETADRFLEARIDRERQSIVLGGRETLVRPYPISIEWPSHWAKAAPAVDVCRREVLAELGLPPDALLGVGVDRLDYTKGIEERLLAVERLLERFPRFRGRFTFVQLAAPSRTAIERYRQLNEAVEALAARINQRFGDGRYRPVILLRQHHEPPRIFRYYRAADLCYVSSLHDGMNLVAKEFVAARDDELGVLLLSRFTGAARELTEALLVNPYDLEEASAALAAALEMSPAEQRERMRAMRAYLTHFNVYRWAGHMLADAALSRQKERLSGRLASGGEDAEGHVVPLRRP